MVCDGVVEEMVNLGRRHCRFDMTDRRSSRLSVLYSTKDESRFRKADDKVVGSWWG
jgi:hypothetical protein